MLRPSLGGKRTPIPNTVMTKEVRLEIIKRQIRAQSKNKPVIKKIKEINTKIKILPTKKEEVLTKKEKIERTEEKEEIA